MATDYGTDIALDLSGDAPDMPAHWSLVSGTANLAQALLRRFQTKPRGVVARRFPGHGLDLRDYVHEEFTPRRYAELRAAIILQAEADPRVLSASPVVSLDTRTSTLTVRLTVATANGPFDLVLAATPTVVTLLKASNV